MRNVNGYERRLVATLDRKRAASVDSCFKPFAIAFAPPVITDARREREPAAGNAMLLAKFVCIHGVPYLFRDTNLGCKRCGSYTAKRQYKPAL